MVTDFENRLRNEFTAEIGEKAYIGYIGDGDEIIWKEKYVKWLEKRLEGFLNLEKTKEHNYCHNCGKISTPNSKIEYCSKCMYCM